jgi:xylan 1,4-beta-xylosidase
MSILDGGFGLINLQSLQKPTFHAFRLLRWLGDEVIELQVDNGIVTRDSKSGFISAIIFHYPPEMITSPPPSSFGRQVADRTVATGKLTRKKLVLEHLKPGSVFRVETLAPGQQGDVVCAWKKLGSPDSISHELMRQLKDYSARLPVEIVEAGSTGNLVIDEEFPPWSVRAIKQIN